LDQGAKRRIQPTYLIVKLLKQTTKYKLISKIKVTPVHSLAHNDKLIFTDSKKPENKAKNYEKAELTMGK